MEPVKEVQERKNLAPTKVIFPLPEALKFTFLVAFIFPDKIETFADFMPNIKLQLVWVINVSFVD